MKNKNSKKTKMIIIMILFVFAGLVGYGVYSYYWTTGTFSGEDTVTFASFNPQTYINGSDFLGNGGQISLSCSVDQNGDGSDNICTGSLTIANEGDTDIDLTIFDAQASAELHRTDGAKQGPADDMSISTSNPQFGWTTKTIEPGESEELSISVPVDISNGFESYNSIRADDPIYDTDSYVNYYTVDVNFKAKAEQVH